MEDVFVGREAELSRLAQVVSQARQGQPWLVSVEGEPGIGKTALVRRYVSSLAGVRVLSARAAQAESDLEFGVVTQLLHSVEPRVLEGYPVLRGDLERSSSFAVGAQLLGVVGDLQVDGPVAIVIDDVQWADGPSVEALSFMSRRLVADAVLLVAVVRRGGALLGEPVCRMLDSVEHRLRLSLSGLSLDDVEPLAAALGAPKLGPDIIERLYDSTGGNTLYLQTVLSEWDALEQLGPGLVPLPPSLAAAIGDQLAFLPAETRSLLEVLAVLNTRVPLALLGEAAEVASSSSAIEPAVRAGLVDWWPAEPSCPVVVRHPLQRDAIYAALSAGRRRELHARAVMFVDEGTAWAHRVASLDRPDEGLAAQLEQLADTEAAAGHFPLAATHLQWASDVSPGRADRERRLLLAATHLMLTEEARGLALRPVVENAAESALRTCVLGEMAFASGQFAEAEQRFATSLAEARGDPSSQRLAAMIADRLAYTYALLGAGQRVIDLSRWALGTGALRQAEESRTRVLVAIGAAQVGGPPAGLAELAHLDPDPARVDAVDVDGLAYRGVFKLLGGGGLAEAIRDLSGSVKLARQGASFTVGTRAYFWLCLAQYLYGAWDDALLSAEQGSTAAAIHPRQYELPMLHLAAACVPAGRGAIEVAELHAKLAEEAAESLDHDHERLFAGMTRALVCQASGDYPGMTTVLGRCQNDAALDRRSRFYGALWRPLLIEGLIGSGRTEEAGVALRFFAEQAADTAFVQPALAWFEGWLAEERGAADAARDIYQRGEEMASTDSPLYEARLLLAYGRLLRRTGQRREAVKRLRRAVDLYSALQASPFLARAEAELAACGLPQAPTQRRSVLDMTSRESDVARLIVQRRTNREIAAELFITPATVEYHLGNIYAKFGVKGRQQLRRVLADAGQTAPI